MSQILQVLSVVVGLWGRWQLGVTVFVVLKTLTLGLIFVTVNMVDVVLIVFFAGVTFTVLVMVVVGTVVVGVEAVIVLT